METFAELIAEIRTLPAPTVLIPLAVFVAYWIVTRAVRSRVQAAWATTLVLLLDVIVVPTFLISVVTGVTTLGVGQFESIRDAIWALLALSGAWLVSRILRRFVWERYFQRRYGSEAPRILQHLITALLYLVAIGIILVVVLGRSASGVLVSTSVIVGVLGLALQNVLADLFSGITIALEKPFSVGDWISMPDGTMGRVTDISWQATHLKSLNESTLVIPNGYALRNVVHNYSRPTRQYAEWIEISVDRSYEPSTVRRLLLEAALTCQSVLKSPTPVVNISDASGNPIRYLVYVHFASFLAHYAGKNDLFMNIHTFLTRAGVSTAAPKYEVSTEPAETRTMQMPSLREELGSAGIFQMLSEEEIDVLASYASYHTFYPEEVIVRQGTEDSSLLIITSGVVQVTKTDERGNKVDVARLGSGDILGEMSLLTGERRSATITALVQVTLIQVTRDGLEPLLKNNPELSDAFAQVMLERQLHSKQFIESMKKSNKAASDFVSDYLEAFVRRIQRFFRI
jgi:small-conductance mechanosensitive channel